MKNSERLEVIGLRIVFLCFFFISVYFFIQGITEAKEQIHIAMLLKEIDEAKEIPSDILNFEWGDALKQGLKSWDATTQYMRLKEEFSKKKLVVALIKVVFGGFFAIGALGCAFQKKEELLRDMHTDNAPKKQESNEDARVNANRVALVQGKYCPYCGGRVEETDKFCIRCGNKIL